MHMPNGNPNFDIKGVQTWFAPIEGILLSFAASHNLLVDRYYHDSPSWSFRFNHPRGGQAAVGVYRGRDEFAGIDSVWHIDDYDRFSRYIHWRKLREIEKADGVLGRELQLELTAILAVPLGQWTQVANGYAQVWGQYTKAQFQGMIRQYPNPIP
jgi:hypothetical protein